MPVNKYLTIENAKLIFRNFAGEEKQFNNKGNRNFCVLLDPAIASILKDEGWNIKSLTPRDPEEDLQYFVQIKVNFSKIPPNIYLIAGGKKTRLTEQNVNVLDFADIETVDLTINPSPWEVRGTSGIKGYVKTMWVTLVDNELENKYRNIPDSSYSLDPLDEEDV